MRASVVWWTRAIAVSLLLMVEAPLSAGVIWELSPSAAVVTAGDSLNVDINISGLGLGGPPSVGAFEFDVLFDPAILAPVTVQFGTFLGDPGLFEALTDTRFAPGVINLAEVSLLPPAALDALQPAAFTLATIEFTAVASGSTTLRFGTQIVDDAFGNKIPEPSSGVLLLTGAALALLIGRIRLGRLRPSRP